MNKLCVTLLLCVSLCAATAFAQGVFSEAPGRSVSVDGRSLYLYCTGEGSPTVLFEAGLGDGSINFRALQARIAPFTRACAYDRAGYGLSDAGPEPRDLTASVSDLEKMLAAAGEDGPYVLVGHSYGGLIALGFANHNRGSVRGVVLVDSSHPEQLTALQSVPEVVTVQDMEIAGLADLVGAAEAGALPAEAVLPSAPSGLPAALQQAWAEFFVSPKQLKATVAEYDSLEASLAQAAARFDLGNTPLIVLSRGIGLEGQLPAEALDALGLTPDVLARFNAVWNGLQLDLTTVSTSSKRVVAERSTHYVYQDQPALVEAAIRELVRKARTPSPN